MSMVPYIVTPCHVSESDGESFEPDEPKSAALVAPAKPTAASAHNNALLKVAPPKKQENDCPCPSLSLFPYNYNDEIGLVQMGNSLRLERESPVQRFFF
jgi:hypothetical protein